MSITEDTDQDIARKAEQALAEAQSEAKTSGLSRVVVEGNRLVEHMPDGSVVPLKTLPQQMEVVPGTKKAKS